MVPLLMKALEYDPDYIAIFAVLGKAYRNLNQFDKAREAYNVALTVGPGDPQIIGNLGALELSLGNGKAAYGHYQYASYHLDRMEARDQAVTIANFAYAAAMAGHRNESYTLLARAETLGYPHVESLKKLIDQY